MIPFIIPISKTPVIGGATDISWIRSNWLNKLSVRLEPHFNERGLSYPQGLSVEGAIPTGLDEVMGLLQGGMCAWPHLHCEPGSCTSGCSPQPPQVSVRVDVPQDFAAGVLIHELIHSCLPYEEAHGEVFEGHARSFGLVGHPSRTATGPDTLTFLNERVYPHLDEYPSVPPHWEVRPERLAMFGRE